MILGLSANWILALELVGLAALWLAIVIPCSWVASRTKPMGSADQ